MASFATGQSRLNNDIESEKNGIVIKNPTCAINHIRRVESSTIAVALSSFQLIAVVLVKQPGWQTSCQLAPEQLAPSWA